MNRIPPINVGASQNVAPTVAGRTPVLANDQPAQSAGSVAGTIVQQNSSSVMTSQTQNTAITNMTSMLQTIGQLLGGGEGSSQTDKTMQLLVAAMFLLAILDQMQQEQGGDKEQSLSQLGNQSSDRSAYMGVFSSSTTISITQTSMSMSYESTSMVAETSQAGESSIDTTA